MNSAHSPGISTFTLIGLTSFGGCLNERMMRDFVREQRWLGEEDRLNGLALSQALLGVGVKNLAIWIGYRLCGWRGMVAEFMGIILPPTCADLLAGHGVR